MHKIILITIISLFGALQTPIAIAQDDKCKTLGKLAESIMTIRQSGLPLSDMMEKIDNGFEKSNSKIARNLTISAYKKFHFSVQDSRKRAAKEFRTEIELKCYQGN